MILTDVHEKNFRHFVSRCLDKKIMGYSTRKLEKSAFAYSRPCLCIRLAITACPTHLEGQTSPEASIPLISMIFMCCCTPLFGVSGIQRQKYLIFSWTSFKTLSMYKVGHHCLSDPFGRSNEPQSEHTLHFDDFCVL